MKKVKAKLKMQVYYHLLIIIQTNIQAIFMIKVSCDEKIIEFFENIIYFSLYYLKFID
jgi:hypothetical protein